MVLLCLVWTQARADEFDAQAIVPPAVTSKFFRKISSRMLTPLIAVIFVTPVVDAFQQLPDETIQAIIAKQTKEHPNIRPAKTQKERDLVARIQALLSKANVVDVRIQYNDFTAQEARNIDADVPLATAILFDAVEGRYRRFLLVNADYWLKRGEVDADVLAYRLRHETFHLMTVSNFDLLSQEVMAAVVDHFKMAAIPAPAQGDLQRLIEEALASANEIQAEKFAEAGATRAEKRKMAVESKLKMDLWSKILEAAVAEISEYGRAFGKQGEIKKWLEEILLMPNFMGGRRGVLYGSA